MELPETNLQIFKEKLMHSEKSKNTIVISTNKNKLPVSIKVFNSRILSLKIKHIIRYYQNSSS